MDAVWIFYSSPLLFSLFASEGNSALLAFAGGFNFCCLHSTLILLIFSRALGVAEGHDDDTIRYTCDGTNSTAQH